MTSPSPRNPVAGVAGALEERSLATARDVALAIGGGDPLGVVLTLICARAQLLVPARASLVWLVDGAELVLAAREGDATSTVGLRLPIRDATAGVALRERRVVHVPDIALGLPYDLATIGLSGPVSACLVPMVHQGDALGLLASLGSECGEPLSGSMEADTLRPLAASAATAVAGARSTTRERVERSVSAAEEERGRWARELHDQTLQGLGAMRMLLRRASRDADAVTRRRIEDVVEQVDDEIYALRHIIDDLRPAALDALGLAPALRALLARAADRHGLVGAVDLDLGPGRLGDAVETAAYRIVQEAVSNVVRHARARTVRLAVHTRDGELRIAVEDDGVGRRRLPRDGPPHLGVSGMRERARLLGGRLEVSDGATGGTAVRVVLPLGPPRA